MTTVVANTTTSCRNSKFVSFYFTWREDRTSVVDIRWRLRRPSLVFVWVMYVFVTQSNWAEDESMQPCCTSDFVRKNKTNKNSSDKIMLLRAVSFLSNAESGAYDAPLRKWIVDQHVTRRGVRNFRTRDEKSFHKDIRHRTSLFPNVLVGRKTIKTFIRKFMSHHSSTNSAVEK